MSTRRTAAPLRAQNRRTGTGEPAPDPFGERRPAALHWRADLLGGAFDFHTDCAELMRIVRHAYAGLPPQRLRASAPRLSVRLVLTAPGSAPYGRAPPPPRPLAAGGMLCAALAGAAFVSVEPAGRRALIAVPRSLLRFPYQLRYELLEFAVYMLAARCQGLVPLHAACVGHRGAGALLLGSSGAGKSTLALASLVAGLEFLAEDSVLVSARGFRATGVANFLHARAASLRLLRPSTRVRDLKSAPVIRRRSGVRKLEIDLRGAHFRLARVPLPIRALIFLTDESAGGDALLRPLQAATVARRLKQGQRYAAGQAGWRAFVRRARNVPAFELRRAAPAVQVAALRALLQSARG